jgi:hypothetical protein
MLAQKVIVRRMQSAGYRITGCRDAIGDGRDGPLVVTAEHSVTGKRHVVSVDTKGDAGEIEAVRQLAEQIGIRLDEGQ